MKKALKKDKLFAVLAELESVCVAFSSGLDSTFLLAAASEVLGDKVLAVTAKSGLFPQRELSEAEDFCKKRGIRHLVAETDALKNEGFRDNPANRCYLCKKELFTKICNIANEHGTAVVAEGSNADDDGDYRPGMQAIAELGVRSPLKEAGLTKAEIRELSKDMGLSSWDKPPFACLASRFVYGERISDEKLAMVEAAEDYLTGQGFRQVRVRIHGENLARIEAEPKEFKRLTGLAQEIEETLRRIGFLYVAMDLGGYRPGSMNRELSCPRMGGV